MSQRRMNNWTTASYRGIKCLDGCHVSIFPVLRHSILETFSDEHLIKHRGYGDAGIPLK